MKIAVFNTSSSQLFLPSPLNIGLKAGEKKVLSIREEDWAAINSDPNIQRVIRARMLRISDNTEEAKAAPSKPPVPTAAPKAAEKKEEANIPEAVKEPEKAPEEPVEVEAEPSEAEARAAPIAEPSPSAEEDGLKEARPLEAKKIIKKKKIIRKKKKKKSSND